VQQSSFPELKAAEYMSNANTYFDNPPSKYLQAQRHATRAMQGMAFHPIEGLMYLAPASLVWMALFAALFEFPAIARDGSMAIVWANPGLFAAAASMGFAVMALAFFTIQLCGSLTLKARRRCYPCLCLVCSPLFVLRRKSSLSC
jgi:hypothetical protein